GGGGVLAETSVPLPPRPPASPASWRIREAACTVPRVTPSAVASSRGVGSLDPEGRTPAEVFCSIAFSGCPDRGFSEARSSAISDDQSNWPATEPIVNHPIGHASRPLFTSENACPSGLGAELARSAGRGGPLPCDRRACQAPCLRSSSSRRWFCRYSRSRGETFLRLANAASTFCSISSSSL